jgi:phenylalanyl-tRNA synthetase beta chain
MPVVAVSVKRLNRLLTREHPMDDLVYALQQLGCDVEDTAEMALYRCPACQAPNDKLSQEDPPKRCDYCGHESETPFERFAVDKVIRLDLLADRPDLFDAGGLARALKGWLGIEQGLPRIPVADGPVSVAIDPILSQKGTYRPHIACALVELPPLDQDSLREIMRLQENLHWGIGRDRKLASIGVYDMDTLEPPIRYTTVDPKTFTFQPLGIPGTPMSGKRILEEHPKGVAYAHLMDEYTRYPILIDAREQVLAMPPIINSDETKCRLGTTRLFIDVTGIARDPVLNSLKTLVSALVEIGGRVETVRMQGPDGELRTPDLNPRTIDLHYEEAVRWTGLGMTPDEFMGYLRKMRLDVEPAGKAHRVTYPAFRTDIRHEVDLFEDLAIGYGYDRIQPEMVRSLTIGKARPEEELSGIVRQAMLGLGFQEIMTLNLQSIERHFTRFRMEPGEEHLVVANPKTIEQKVVRSHMKTGVMETLQKNRRKAMPQKVFELGNVLLLDPEAETGVREYRHLAFGITGPQVGYAEARQALDAVLREIGRTGEYQPVEQAFFNEGRGAEVTGDSGLWAQLGEIHPEILNAFQLVYPAVFCELRLLRVI